MHNKSKLEADGLQEQTLLSAKSRNLMLPEVTETGQKRFLSLSVQLQWACTVSVCANCVAMVSTVLLQNRYP